MYEECLYNCEYAKLCKTHIILIHRKRNDTNEFASNNIKWYLNLTSVGTCPHAIFFS